MKTSDAWSMLDQLNQGIRSADAKASVLLASSGALGGILLSQPLAMGHDASVTRSLLWGVGLVAVAFSAVCSLRALLPRLRVRRAEPRSLVYFDHIARRFPSRADEYITAFAQVVADADVMWREIAAQVWANSLVARRKFRQVTLATWFVGLALLCAGLVVYLERA